MAKVKLRDIAHARTGDKGNTSNISLILFKEDLYELVKKEVTAELVEKHFRNIAGEVIRYELPNLCAFNFVIKNALCGGVTSSLACDIHGKCLSSSLLNISIDI